MIWCVSCPLFFVSKFIFVGGKIDPYQFSSKKLTDTLKVSLSLAAKLSNQEI